MRILQTVVSAVGFREVGYTTAKRDLLDGLASFAAETSCDVLHLPAGFVLAADIADADSFIRVAAGIGRRHDVAIIGGVDLPEAKRRRKKKRRKRNRRAVRTRRLPYLGFATEPSGRCHGLRASWRQVSTDSEDAEDAPDLDVAERVIAVRGCRLAVLVCGEMHNPGIRGALKSLDLGAVLVSGHRGLGQGLVPTLRAVSSVTGVPTLHAQHLVGKSGSLHCVGGRRASNPMPRIGRIVAHEPGWGAATMRVG